MLTDKDIQFIKENLNKSVELLSLSRKRPNGVNFQLCLNSIAAAEKLKKKVPLWANNPALAYPLPLSLEQCSSQATGEYKSHLITRLFTPDNNILIADITGGMGIDSYFISKAAKALLYIERNKELCKAAAHNFKILNALNINIINAEIDNDILTKELKEFAASHNKNKLNIIFADPARRGKHNDKVIRLEDYEPDILSLNSTLLNLADYLLIKVSPMADIKMYLKKLKNVIKVFIVSVDNECKELLFLMQSDEIKNRLVETEAKSETDPEIEAVALQWNSSEIKHSLTFRYSTEEATQAKYADNSNFKYLYEPDKSILKAAAFKLITSRYNVQKIAPSTHLYCSNKPATFPGKIFEVLETFEFGKKAFKEIKQKYPEASVTARNLPITSNNLKKMLKLKESNNIHIFAFSNSYGEKIISVTKIAE